MSTSTNDELIKNIHLKEWIKENYHGMIEDGESCLVELDYLDMDNFAFWLEDKIYQETLKEKIEQI